MKKGYWVTVYESDEHNEGILCARWFFGFSRDVFGGSEKENESCFENKILSRETYQTEETNL